MKFLLSELTHRDINKVYVNNLPSFDTLVFAQVDFELAKSRFWTRGL